MTRAEAKEMLPFIEAWASGKQVQEEIGKGIWIDVLENCMGPNPFIGGLRFRLKPTLNRVPLGPDDVKPGDVFNHVNCMGNGWVAPSQVDSEGVSFAWSNCLHLERWDELMKNYMISRDGGKTWKSCWKENA